MKLPPKDLQELVDADIITAETAQQIAAWYQSKQDSSPNKFNFVLGILGAILVGSGIVLLIAHNWDYLNKVAKTIIAFLPLAIGQALCLYTLLRKNDNRTWQEGSATILFFAVPTCISLISQIYHIDGTLTKFILVWLFLMLPVIYLLNASIVSLLSIAGITWYACLIGYDGIFSKEASYPYMYGLFLLLIVPHYYRFARSRRQSNFFHLHNWMLVISICITLGTFISRHTEPSWGFAGYMSLFGLLYLLGTSDYFKEHKLFSNPALVIGLPGILVILMFWSFDSFWIDNQRHNSPTAYYGPFFYITLVLLVTGIVLMIQKARSPVQTPDPISISAYVFCLLAFLFAHQGAFASFIVNSCILVIAIFYIRKGSLQNHLGILNFGLLIIAVLALLRFFDDSIPFIWRGIFFVAAGAGFFAANYLLLKKRKTITQNNNA
jgi:uncharacterized membrane protein